MIIERVQGEEGFLDGLDLSLSKGWNVLIGLKKGSRQTHPQPLVLSSRCQALYHNDHPDAIIED
jgi:hypothetical protein